MVKLILEYEDIEKLIKEKYNVIEIKGLPEDLEISVKIEDFAQPKKVNNVVPTQSEPVKQAVLTPDGSIDANASGLTLENKGVTQPGGPMKKERGRLPVF